MRVVYLIATIIVYSVAVFIFISLGRDFAVLVPWFFIALCVVCAMFWRLKLLNNPTFSFLYMNMILLICFIFSIFEIQYASISIFNLYKPAALRAFHPWYELNCGVPGLLAGDALLLIKTVLNLKRGGAGVRR